MHKIAAAAVAFTCLATAASAATVIEGSASNATGLEGLVVDGSSYNVQFALDTYDDVYGASTPLFSDNSSLAHDAFDALLSFLNANSVAAVGGGNFEVQLPYTALYSCGSGGCYHAYEAINNYYGPGWIEGGGSGYWNFPENSTYGHNVIAQFSVDTPTSDVPVPEPWVPALLAAGLFGLAMTRRRGSGAA